MSDSPADRTDRRRDIEYDNWPVRRYDDYANWPVERTTPDGRSEPAENVEWVGATNIGAGGGAYLYSTNDETIYEGKIDVGNERIVVHDDAAGREVGEDESLADRLAEIGDERGWNWLSSFAREHLDADEREDDGRDATADYHVPDGFEHRDVRFQRRNLAESDDADVAFFASHTFEDESGRVHVLEREFDVDAPDSGADAGTASARVSVEEEYLVAADERAEDRSGDAEIVDEREYELDIDVDSDAPSREARIEENLQKWHRGHLAAPAD